MIRWILVGTIAATAALAVSSGHGAAFACNRIAGCTMDVFREDYEMKRDGRMDEAIQAGRENVQAFRAPQPAQQKGNARK